MDWSLYSFEFREKDLELLAWFSMFFNVVCVVSR